MKSVLHIALIAPGGFSNAGLMKAFFENGFLEYTCFDYQEKIFNSDKEAMRRMLIQETERLKPDIVFGQIQGSEILDMDTFKRLSEISFTINYTFDIRTPEQTEWLYNLAPVLGLICFSNQRDVDECKRRGYENVMVLQSSVDTEVYKPGNELGRKGIAFIGNNFENTNHQFPLSKERREMVEFLQMEFSEQFKVSGNNWGGSKLIMQKEEIEIYQRSLIAINHNNFDAELYTSDRLWRILACWTFCLTKYFKGIEKLFTRKLHLDWWEDFDELKQKINYYLSNPDEIERISFNGYRHVHFNHNWTSRIKEMMRTIHFMLPQGNENLCIKMGAHAIKGVIPEPTDQKFNNMICDCGKIKFFWQECGCQEKEYQLRAQENI